MTGYNTVLQIRRFEERIAGLGLRMAHSRYQNSGENYGSVIALMAKDDSFPLYARDAELFVGTIEEANVWLKGIEWAKEYYRMLGLLSDKKIAAKEDLERQRQLIDKIKEEPKQVKND